MRSPHEDKRSSAVAAGRKAKLRSKEIPIGNLALPLLSLGALYTSMSFSAPMLSLTLTLPSILLAQMSAHGGIIGSILSFS
jgi:hypothetical protein